MNATSVTKKCIIFKYNIFKTCIRLTIRLLNQHLSSIHGKNTVMKSKEFANDFDFKSWKNNIEIITGHKYSAKCLTKKSDYSYSMIRCVKSGKREMNPRKRVPNFNSVKIGKTCPAFISKKKI